MSDPVHDWSRYEPEPQDVGAFARAITEGPPAQAWDEYAQMDDMELVETPYGWCAHLVEGWSASQEVAAAFADAAAASLRDELGEPESRPTVRGYSDATWLDAVAVALGAEDLRLWRTGGSTVALLRDQTDGTHGLWLVAVSPDAASTRLLELVGPATTEDPGDDPVERALGWLQARGLHLGVRTGVDPAAELAAWFPDDVPAAVTERLRPFAKVDGTGSMAATWQDDADRTLVVVLGSEGDGWVLADSPLDFVRLLGVGYREVGRARGPAEESYAVLEAAVVRAWVEETFAVEVPRAWVAGAPDEFSAWLDDALGQPASDPVVPADAPTVEDGAVSGDVLVLLGALGRTDGAAVVTEHLGLPPTATPRQLEDLDVELSVTRAGLQTVFVGSDHPRADRLLGLSLDTPLEDFVARWGTPERLDPEGGWARWVVDGRYLHLGFGPEGVTMVTLMVDAP